MASDWLRSSCHNHPDPAVRQRVLTEAARYLAGLADQLDREGDTDATR